MNGRLPEEIGNMKLLDKLYLANNDFDGGLPVTMGSIGMNSGKQKYIKLNGNRFSGVVPAALGDIPLLCKFRVLLI